SNFEGASLEALVRLGHEKGYRIVGCSIAGVNAFFVRDDLAGDKFLEPATAAEHYEPPRHFFHLLPAGHKGRPGPFVAVWGGRPMQKQNRPPGRTPGAVAKPTLVKSAQTCWIPGSSPLPPAARRQGHHFVTVRAPAPPST